jgi:hypothetical protein
MAVTDTADHIPMPNRGTAQKTRRAVHLQIICYICDLPTYLPIFPKTKTPQKSFYNKSISKDFCKQNDKTSRGSQNKTRRTPAYI